MNLFERASLVVTANAYQVSKLYAIKPEDGGADFEVIRSTPATRVNSNGLIETMVANVPRLDYTGSNCPSILVEPQRTNVLTNSEGNLATYGTALGNVSNASISINGFYNSIQVGNNSVSTAVYKRTFTPIIGVQYTMSIFVQMNDNLLPVLGLNTTTGDFSLIINNTLATLNPTIQKIGISNVYKVSATFTATSTSTIFGVSKSTTQSSKPFRFTGIQLEAGSNSTSYILTTTAIVTRTADAITTKESISKFIGQTSGVIYSNFNITNNDQSNNKTIFSLDNNTGYADYIGARILSNDSLDVIFKVQGSSITFNNMPKLTNGNHKIAIKYGSGVVKIFVNGSLIDVQNWSTPFGGIFYKLFLGKNLFASTYFNDRIKSVIIFNETLADIECVSLTKL